MVPEVVCVISRCMSKHFHDVCMRQCVTLATHYMMRVRACGAPNQNGFTHHTHVYLSNNSDSNE